MVDQDSGYGVPLNSDEMVSNAAGLPEQLPGDPRRQAVYSMQGDVYQAWWSIDSWLQLSEANEAIYLEGAEDFDKTTHDAATAVQVKQSKGTISLGTKKALEALENFWNLSLREVNRRVDFHYLTTSTVAMEKDANFGGAKGIELWRAAQTNMEFANEVSQYLIAKLDNRSPLRSFLNSATAEHVQENLLRRFHWLTDQPNIEAIKRSVDDRIAVLLTKQRRPLCLIQNVKNYLFYRFWELIIKPSSDQRCLTYGDLLQQVADSTNVHLSVPLEYVPDFLRNEHIGSRLLRLLLDKTTKPPEPLLQRPALIQRLEGLVKHRKVVLLTGTVHKGKTTAAQLVSSILCPEAWWVNLSGRQIEHIDNVLIALAGRVEKGECPSLVIIDDLDISPNAYSVYRDSLAMLIHRAISTGRGIILTARGGTNDSAIVLDFKSLELLEVPELSTQETEAICVEHGCPPALASLWGNIINVSTAGHPKLVQVRLAELVKRGWPSPIANDFLKQSSAVTTTRQIARRLLSDSAPGPIVEFVYLVSETSVLLHRTVAIRLAETVKGLTNGGDVLDSLTGKWLECIEGEWFRTTALLVGVAGNAWSPEKLKSAHIRLHDALLAKKTLDPIEAAALLFHAFRAGDNWRLVNMAMQYHKIDSNEVQIKVERQLLWLPFIALNEGQSIVSDAMASAILRSLQFQVALTLDSDFLSQICSRWADDIERIPHPEARACAVSLMHLRIGSAMSSKVPLKARLKAVVGTSTLHSKLIETYSLMANRLFDNNESVAGLPKNGTIAQAMFLFAIQSIRGLNSLEEMLHWLDNDATEDIRLQFDQMIGWPLVQSLGAFVQGAWAAVHEQTKDWEPWLLFLDRINEYAIRRDSPLFGHEAAKARAIILTEYFPRAKDALKVLEQAEVQFGPSLILKEQRANVLFHERDDDSVLEIWKELTRDQANRIALDPFAYRRAGMSAARLKQWEISGQIFAEGADSLQPGSFDLTRFGLLVDSALATSLGRNQSAAAKILADAVLALPPEAAEEGEGRWEAVLRAAVTVCGTVKDSVWKRTEYGRLLEPGFASSPDWKVGNVQPGQPARFELTQAQILHLYATISEGTSAIYPKLNILFNSNYSSVRWLAREAHLSLSYSTGAGPGFVEALLEFDRAISDYMTIMKEPNPLLMSDDGPKSGLQAAPENWFGLLCAGVICAGPALLACLKIWLDDSTRLLGEEAGLTKNIRLILKGASLHSALLLEAISDLNSAPTMRVGAAAQLILEKLEAKKSFQIQSFLTSALVTDGSFTRQEIFNCHIARCFAGSWYAHAQNQFQFYSPNTSVPALLSVLEGVDRARDTLKSVLTVAASALRQPLGDFMDRVL